MVALSQQEAYARAPALLAEALADEYSDDPEDYKQSDAGEWDEMSPAHCNFVVTADSVQDFLSGLKERGRPWAKWEMSDGYSCVQRERAQTVAGASRCGVTLIDCGEHRIVYFGGF